MRERQNTREALELLLIQRRLYSKSKKWGRLRLIGVLVLGVVTPVVTLFHPNAAVIAGAVAAVWIFLARTIFKKIEATYAVKAAGIQDEFDTYVFGIESTAKVGEKLTPEERADLLPNEDEFDSVVKSENLIDWYPFDDKATDELNIAVAQRANAAYTDRLLRANSSLLIGLTVIWLICIVGYAVFIAELTAYQLVLGVIAPILPGLLDNFENWSIVRQASVQRRSLAKEIEDKSSEDPKEIRHLLESWQSRTYDLRITTPNIPDLLYGLLRTRNERAMEIGAKKIFNLQETNAKRK